MIYTRDSLRRRRLLTSAPWVHDANWTDAYFANPRVLGFPNPGASVTSWIQNKGSHAPNVLAGIVYQRNFNSRSVPQLQFNGSVAPSISIDGLAPFLNDPGATGKPWSIMLSGNLPAAPSGPFWYIWSFRKIGNSVPAVVLDGSSGTTTVFFNRRNNANVTASGGAMAIGTSPFVIGGICDGAVPTCHLTSFFNRTLIDNNIPFGSGALSVDTHQLGSSATVAQSFSFMNLTGYLFSPSAVPLASLQREMAYEMRRLGIP